jgi:hypothetical protein
MQTPKINILCGLLLFAHSFKINSFYSLFILTKLKKLDEAVDCVNGGDVARMGKQRISYNVFIESSERYRASRNLGL